MPYCFTAYLNYSIKVVGFNAAMPVVAILIGSSVVISVAHRTF